MIIGMILMMAAIAALVGGYTYWRFRKAVLFAGGNWKQKKYKIITALIVIIMMVLCINMWSTSAVFVLHVVVVSMALDVIVLVIGKMFSLKKSNGADKKTAGKVSSAISMLYYFEIITVLIVAAIITYGYINMGHIKETDYVVHTEKEIQDYQVGLVTDVHYNTIQDTALVKQAAEEMSAKNLDLVILGGDIVEEGTSKQSMQEVFEILGNIQTKYGVYYVYGNHDRQPYAGASAKTYTDEELVSAIESNGITILEDSYVEVNDDLVVAGRADAAWGDTSGRAKTAEILQGVDTRKFILMADHQPIKAEENSVAGVDLEVSGHTHAGQIWPVGVFSNLFGVLNYGEYQKDNCTVITSSGMAGWGYTIRTQESCEYCVIKIQNKVE